ncbi:chromate transporter [Alkalihalobacillus oceani]|uniref:Chromate transporter n=1 Tax=Halalkalibacter oceani TaxID=1653776 RepID=A0A9X2IQ23_9BACI|nr:chromate transporter [Halalkalibacter oceani]MCM3716644.1 chromate transporter [Halalkalibacter oceani]
MLVELFLLFMMIGTVSFGGGYAMIPIIETEVISRGWLSTAQLTDIIAVAGMSPGPIATNAATFVGFYVAGVPGALVSTVAMTLPSFLIILIIVSFFYRFNQNKVVKSAFYGIRPIITSLILFAAIRFGISNNVFSISVHWHELSLLLIFCCSLTILLWTRTHPVLVIIGAGVIGVFLY